MSLKSIFRKLLLTALAPRGIQSLRRSSLSSRAYWEERYRKGGTSGAGSYGQIAGFKAEFLNKFVERQRIQSVIEFGCGDGNQLSMSNYPNYIGLDVARFAIERCIARFNVDASKSFFLYDSKCFLDSAGLLRAELALSLDVLYHLVEDEEFDRYLRHLFGSSKRFVIIFSTNFKAKGATAPHVLHRQFTSWVDCHMPDWRLIQHVENTNSEDRDSSVASFFVYSLHD